MPKKHLPSCWSLVPANTPVSQPEPALLTDDELAEVHKLFVPIEAIIEQYIEDSHEYPYDIILEALARAMDYYEGLQAYIDAEIDKDIAAEEADA